MLTAGLETPRSLLLNDEKMRVAAVVFDLDGTLIESIHVSFIVLNTALERVGLPPVAWEEVLDTARKGHFDWNILLPGKDETRERELLLEARKIIGQIQPEILRREVRLIQGAVETLKILRAGGLRIGLVTATRRMYLEGKLHCLKEAGVAHWFEVILTTDDVTRRKPYPEPLIECGQKMGLHPEKMVYVGDTWVDIRAGKTAGTKTIGVLTGLDDYDALLAEEPDAIIESVRDLKEMIWIPTSIHSTASR